MKKKYIQPCIRIFCLQHREQLMKISGLNTTSASSDVNLEYDKNGGNLEDAW